MKFALQILFFINVLFLNIKCSNELLKSPCPTILKYLPKSDSDNTGGWNAEIVLSTEDELQGVWVHIVLNKKADTLLNWFGESTTIDNQEFSIRNPEYKLQEGPSIRVKIRVLYNETDPHPPSVKRIRLNGRTICAVDNQLTRTTAASKPFISRNKPVPEDNDGSTHSSSTQDSLIESTTEWKMHQKTTQPRRWTTTTESTRNAEFFGGDFSHLTFGQSNARADLRPSGLKDHVKCGMPIKRATPLITHGTPSVEGAWPWHIAMYTSTGLQLTYICGGSLITKRHILTAAHCVVIPNTNQPADTEGFLIHLGRTFLKRFGSGVQQRQVQRIIVHPNFNQTYFHNDVAILVLSRPVTYTDFVRPVCLWMPGQNDTIIGKLGTVVGWGFDETRHITDALQETKMPVVDLLTCIYSNPDIFNKFTSVNNFCAGFMNGSSVCNGDSGGGMFFERPVPGEEHETHWELRGMVSVSQVLQKTFCDPYGYTVFTDVLKFSEWINKNIQD